jgi:hypothetical protein
MPTTPNPGSQTPVSAEPDAVEQRWHAPASEHTHAEAAGGAVSVPTARPSATTMATVNPAVRLLLRSPLHLVLSDRLAPSSGQARPAHT